VIKVTLDVDAEGWRPPKGFKDKDGKGLVLFDLSILSLPSLRASLLRMQCPLPPLAEQAAIVERVEALMAHCRALETEIEHSRTHADHLLQAVLKEAFSPVS
jgi:hypothetical protein